MNALVLRPRCADLETDRIVAALGSRGAVVLSLRGDKPATLLRSAISMRSELRAAPIVHAFGFSSLFASLLMTCSPVVFTPIGFPTRAQIGWLRAAMAYRCIHIVASSQTMHRALVTRGIELSHCHLVRPGVRLSDIPTTRDRALRERLGFTDADTLLYAPLELTHAAGHVLAAWAVSILGVMQPQYKLLFHNRGTARAPLEHLKQHLIDPRALTIVDDVAPEALFSAADAILMTPNAPVSPLVIATAMASSRPIIATTTRQLCEQLEDRHTALLVKEPSPRLVAQRIIDLFADPTLSWQLQDRARAEAYDHFTQSRMLKDLDAVYDTACGACQARSSPILMKPSEA